MFGLADLRGTRPRFDGALGLSDGLARGYPVSGGADLSYDGRTARGAQRRGGAGRDLRRVLGRASTAVGQPAMAYDLDASVPLGDVGEVRRVLQPAAATLEGSFSADVRVRGSGARPRVAGDVRAPEGSYNGLAFRDARASSTPRRGAVAARDGTITVGSTHARVDSSVAGRAFALDVRAERRQPGRLQRLLRRGRDARRARPGRVRAGQRRPRHPHPGRVDVAGLRFRRFPFGTTDAHWSQRGGAVDGALAVHSAHGVLHAGGTVVPAAGDLLAAFRGGTYRVAGRRPGGRPGHLAAAVRPDRADPGPGRRPRQPGGPLPAPGRRRRRDPAARLGLRLCRPGGPRPRPQQRGADRAQRHQRRPRLRPVRRQRLVRPRRARPAGAGDPRARPPTSPRRWRGSRPRPTTTSPARCRPTPASAARGRPAGRAGLRRRAARATRRSPIPRVLGNVASNGTHARGARRRATFAKGSVLLAGSLPISLQPPGVRARAPFSFTLALTGLDLAPFAPFVPGPHDQARRDGRRPGRDRGHARGAAGDRLGRAGERLLRSDFERAPSAGPTRAWPSRAPASGSTPSTPASGAERSTAAAASTCPSPMPQRRLRGRPERHRARLDLPAVRHGPSRRQLRLVSARPLPLLRAT